MPIRWPTAGAIAASLLAACTAAPSVSDIPTPTPTASPSASAIRIEDVEIAPLRIEEPDWKASGVNWALELSWQAPVDAVIDHYEVRRNGVTVANSVGEETFRDDGVEPGARYRYEVVGVDADGRQTMAAVSSIKTRAPKLSVARLEGTFAVRMTVRRSSGTKNPVRGRDITFGFDPTCRSGACSVRWTVGRARTNGILRRMRAMYVAKLRTPLFVRNCFGDVIREALDVRLKVTKAAPLGDAWRATKIEGTIAEVSSYRGCKTATIGWTVHGSLQS
ncbi:MAG: fibronectin type III domain-containing protein [Actinomycetota bacterium]|nr:fibronectin type III domain-containing protein [Actinomycetota bacterium]MDH5313607.1 fibronectin type III domain-containing protein [Actinomycetota bacterium]